VNSRDLTSFSLRTESLAELAELLPANAVRVAESGIRTAEDIAMLRAAGYHAFLVGETIMRQPDVGAALSLLLDREYSREI
jgi:indole-3-glycerol phosphate synthase